MRNMLHDILDMGFSQWQEKLTAMGEDMKGDIDSKLSLRQAMRTSAFGGAADYS